MLFIINYFQVHKSHLIPRVYQGKGSSMYLYVQQLRPAVGQVCSPAPNWAGKRWRREQSHCALVLLLLRCFGSEGVWRCRLQTWVLWKDAFINQVKSSLPLRPEFLKRPHISGFTATCENFFLQPWNHSGSEDSRTETRQRSRAVHDRQTEAWRNKSDTSCHRALVHTTSFALRMLYLPDLRIILFYNKPRQVVHCYVHIRFQ